MREVSAIEDSTSEIKVQIFPGICVFSEVRGDNPNDAIADLPISQEGVPVPHRSIISYNFIGEAQIRTQNINAALSILFPIFC